jgi:uncharacterized protein HemY
MTLTVLFVALMTSFPLAAQNSYKDANNAYRADDYARAAELFTAALAADADSKDIQPAYFFLANCLDQLYNPNKKGEPANDALLKNAVKYYRMAADRLSTSDNPEYKMLGKISRQYLVSAYGVNKLNDPATAEQLLREMISTDPGDVANYFTLAQLYEDENVYAEAERTLQSAKNAQPNDSKVDKRIAGFYNRHPEMKR